MKTKILPILFCIFLTGCAGQPQTARRAMNENPTNNVNAVILAQSEQGALIAVDMENIQAEVSTPEPVKEEPPVFESEPLPEIEIPETIDIDLPSMSATMVYSEVSNMIMAPNAYIGKVVKMEGFYSYFLDPNTGNEYHNCIIQDATACCAQGLEFELQTTYEHQMPYLTDGMTITVVGTFDTYEEDGILYCTLRNAVLL